MPIDIKYKKDCVGCNACVQRCPKQCIAMNRDEQGFLYPKVNLSLCIDCGLCGKVCPVINKEEARKPLASLAARNKDSAIMNTSSSGGIFHALASKIIEEGGIVFGARFDTDWSVIHDYIDTLEGISAFQTSKYLQSRIGDTFLKAEKFLKEGRKVMFTGTPCQTAGLRLFLRKDYDQQLLLVDVACHGVPSPLVWADYLNRVRLSGSLVKTKEVSSRSDNPQYNIESICFRDRRNGWADFGISIDLYDVKSNENKNLFESFRKNLYMQGFLRDLTLRPSCYSCPVKAGRSKSDLTIADFWGIQSEYPTLYKDKKYSLIITWSEKGKQFLNSINNFNGSEVNTEIALSHNSAVVDSSIQPSIYLRFWEEYQTEGLSAINWGINKIRPSIFRRIIRKGKRIIRKVAK